MRQGSSPLLRGAPPPCADHADTYSPLGVIARDSQEKKVYVNTVKVETVYAELWRQVQALFFFIPISLLLPVPNLNCPSAALAPFLACSLVCQHSALNLDLMKVDFT